MQSWTVKPNKHIQGMAAVLVNGVILIPFIPEEYAQKIVEAVEKSDKLVL